MFTGCFLHCHRIKLQRDGKCTSEACSSSHRQITGFQFCHCLKLNLKKTKQNNTQSKKLMFTQGAKSWESLFCMISPSETENASYTRERKRGFVPERVTALAVFLQDINKEGSNCFSTILLLSTFSSEKKSLFSHLGL